MKKDRKEIARLHFVGKPYDEHSLDVAALEELVQFQKIVTETAKAIWKSKHPERKRIPKAFEENTKFCFRVIEEGGAIVPLEQSIQLSQTDLFDGWDEAIQAIEWAHGAFVAVNRDEPLPEGAPRKILPYLAKLGTRLPQGAKLQFAPSGKKMESISQKACTRLMAIANNPYQDELDLIGKVLEADVKKQKFQLWIDDKIKISIPFTEEQESKITTALKEHESTQIKVNGYGEFNAQGVLQKILRLDYLDVYNKDSDFDSNAPSIEDEISKIFGDVSDEEWSSIPSDLSHRHDSYI